MAEVNVRMTLADKDWWTCPECHGETLLIAIAESGRYHFGECSWLVDDGKDAKPDGSYNSDNVIEWF